MTVMTFEYNTEVFVDLARMVVGAPVKLAKAAYTSYKCHEAEKELQGLDARMLQDIGISRSEIHSKVWGQ